MSDNKKKTGRSKKTPAEIEAAFDKLKDAVGLEGLQLFAGPDGRAIVLHPEGILFNNISGTELVSACERACELMQYATHLPGQAVSAESKVA